MLQQLLMILLIVVNHCFALSPSPHLVFIVADDLGWNDVGFHNLDIISPNIDTLARDGIILNQSYVQPLCSPSRTAFMTGIYPFRLGMQHMVLGERQQVCVPLNATFLPQVLKSHGYKTHMVGKWHLGFCKWECTPTFRGFDSFYGYYSGAEEYYRKIYPGGYDFRFNTTVERGAAGNYSTYQYAKRVEDIVNYHDPDTPLYLYLPFQSVHMPLQAPQEHLDLYPNIGDSNRKIFSAMVTALDDAVGHLVTTLKEKGIYNNTIIVFTADNGGWTPYGGNNYPLRGGKASLFEGGTRASAFIHSPLLNRSGVVYDGILHAVDWFPTLLHAAGINFNDPNQDGVNQWESIISLSDSKRTEFVYNMDYDPNPAQGAVAIRVGDYKLLEGFPGVYNDWYLPGTAEQGFNVSLEMVDNFTWSSGLSLSSMSFPSLLFNLKDDPREQHNLFDQLPDVVKNLQDRLAEERKRYVPPNWPVDDPLSEPANYGGVWGPGWC